MVIRVQPLGLKTVSFGSQHSMRGHVDGLSGIGDYSEVVRALDTAHEKPIELPAILPESEALDPIVFPPVATKLTRYFQNSASDGNLMTFYWPAHEQTPEMHGVYGTVMASDRSLALRSRLQAVCLCWKPTPHSTNIRCLSIYPRDYEGEHPKPLMNYFPGEGKVQVLPLDATSGATRQVIQSLFENLQLALVQQRKAERITST